jgi:hypothetical protein
MVGGVGATSRACGGGPTRASSEAESRPRVRIALERGGVSPEGASDPRARRSFARGDSSPRARRSFGVTASGPSSEAEFRPRGAGASRLLGRWGYLGRGRMRCNLPLVSSFVFLLFCEEMGFSPVLRRPLWLSPTHITWTLEHSATRQHIPECL